MQVGIINRAAVFLTAVLNGYGCPAVAATQIAGGSLADSSKIDVWELRCASAAKGQVKVKDTSVENAEAQFSVIINSVNFFLGAQRWDKVEDSLASSFSGVTDGSLYSVVVTRIKDGIDSYELTFECVNKSILSVTQTQDQ